MSEGSTTGARPSKRYVVAGVANEWSIAWASVTRLVAAGATCRVMCLPANLKRVRRMMRELGREEDVAAVDVRSDSELAAYALELGHQADRIDGILHAVAFADIGDIEAGTLAMSRSGFAEAMDVSVYSLAALCRHLRPLLGRGSSVITLSYHGARACVPGYGVMGVAKAALESLVRYLALELGQGHVRVNAISPGPIRTLAASVFPDIDAKIERAAERSPLRQKTSQDDVAKAVEFLLSEGADGVTGQCLYVDHGLSTVAWQ